MYPAPTARRFPTVEKVKADLAAADDRYGGDARYAGWAAATAEALAFDVDTLKGENERLLERIRRAGL